MLELDGDLEEFVLIALHCSAPDFKMAYMLNQKLGLKLQREAKDLEFFYAQYTGLYPLFSYNDPAQDRQIHLVGNTSRTQIDGLANSSSGLFAQEEQQSAQLNYLIPELKQADYLLKINSFKNNLSENVIVSRINEIAQVITAYVVDLQLVKSKNNLIFE